MMPFTEEIPPKPEFAVPRLIEAVRVFFVANSITANVEYGRKKDTQQVNQGEGGANRVVFYWGDGGDKVGGAKIRVKPRVLFTWTLALTVSVWAADETNIDDELAQLKALQVLWEQTMQAVHAYARADGEWDAVEPIKQPIERVFGAALRARLLYKVPMSDVVFKRAVGATPQTTPEMNEGS